MDSSDNLVLKEFDGKLFEFVLKYLTFDFRLCYLENIEISSETLEETCESTGVFSQKNHLRSRRQKPFVFSTFNLTAVRTN